MTVVRHLLIKLSILVFYIYRGNYNDEEPSIKINKSDKEICALMSAQYHFYIDDQPCTVKYNTLCRRDLDTY